MKTKLISLLWLIAAVGFAAEPNRLIDKPTASPPAGDDYIYLDGATNKVRKLAPSYFTGDAATKAAAAQAAAIAAAQTDATTKANAAQAAAIQRANHSGTQPLSTISASGATSGQVAKWNGSAWAPAADDNSGSGAAARTVGALGTNALALTNSTGFGAVKTVTWSTNQVLTYTGGSNTAGDNLLIVATVTSPITLTITPTSASCYRNGSTGALVSAISVPIGVHTFRFWTPNAGSTVYLDDTVVTATDLPVVATPTNYTAASANVESHLTGIDQKFAALSSGSDIHAVTALTDGATITLNAATSPNGKVTLGGNRALVIAGATNGTKGRLFITQDGTGSRTLALPAGSKSPSNGLGVITVSTAAGYTDQIEYVYDGTNYFWNLLGVRYTAAADVTAPTLVSATVASNGTTVTLVFSEAVTRGAGYSAGAFDTDGTVTNNALVYVSGDGTTTWVMTATSTINSTATDNPNIDFSGAANSVEDGAGNDAVAIVNGTVTNGSSQTPSTMLLSDNMEYASSGAAVTAGWVNTTGSPVWAYATSPAPLEGSFSVKLATGDQIDRSFTSSPDVNFYGTFEFTSGIGSDQYPFSITGGSYLKLRADAVLEVHNGTSIVLGSTVLVNGTKYHYWHHYAKGTGANSVTEFYINTSGTKPGSPEISVTDGTLTTNATGIGGYCATGLLIYDTYRVSTTTLGSNP